MSISIDKVFVKQFEADVHLAYQQMGTNWLSPKTALAAPAQHSKKLAAAQPAQNHVMALCRL